MLAVRIDLSECRALVRGTMHVLAAGTARAVRIGLEAGAAHARSHHAHKRRTGLLTSRQMLRGELRQATAEGAWGYLLNETPYARYVEEGTAPHIIRPRLAFGMYGPLQVGQTRRPHNDYGAGRGSFLRFYVGGRAVFARSVKHPGTNPMPFMAPAAQVAEQRIVEETERVTLRLVSELWE